MVFTPSFKSALDLHTDLQKAIFSLMPQAPNCQVITRFLRLLNAVGARQNTVLSMVHNNISMQSSVSQAHAESCPPNAHNLR